MEILGIDIGGTGIKGAPVDIQTGELVQPRLRLLTPVPAKPKAVAQVVAELIQQFNWHGPVGVGFPAVVINGVALTAANIHPKWIETNASELFAETTGCPVIVINDADAAGLAEMSFGAGRGEMGTVLMITIGTGIGTAIFTEGHLLPNCEFGHIKMDGQDAESISSDAVRKNEDLSWKSWAKRLNDYLSYMEALIWPDLIILGGGVIKYHENFLPRLKLRARVVPAQFLNEAGIVGAAMAGRDLTVDK